MSNLDPTPNAEACAAEPTTAPTIEALPGRLTDLAGLPIRRLLPRSARRLVGPWCFLDSYGPLTFSSGKAMDVAPHPHIGLQTVSWLLQGELLHKDSIGLEGRAGPAVLNLMTAGRGVAHSEETPLHGSGRLMGVQLWVALPEASRQVAPSFEQRGALPRVELQGGRATLIMGRLAGAVSPARSFSPIVGAEVSGEPGRRLVLPLEAGFEHAVVLLEGGCTLEGQPLALHTLYYLGCGRGVSPSTERDRLLNEFASDLPTYWQSTRLDAPTMQGALEYLRTQQPRVLYVMLGETDEWAHERRYDQYLDAAWRSDRFLRRLWDTAQSLPAYRSKTALLVATDHGRGATPRDWTDHGKEVPAAERLWMAVLGPRTPALGVREGITATQSQFAATIAALLGADFRAAVPRAAPPLLDSSR